LPIEADSLSFSYGAAAPVLSGVSLAVRDGAVTALMGANACGKTTLLRLMTRGLKPASGRVMLDGADICRMRLKDFAKRVAVVHQHNSAPDDLSVKKLVGFGRVPHAPLACAAIGCAGDSPVDRELVAWAMSVTGVSDIAENPMGALSGGQRQRAFIAMALAQDTGALFLDEPTTFLDVRYQIEILRLIRELNRKHSKTIVMVLHDINQAIMYSDEVVGLAGGGVMVQGPPGEVIDQAVLHGLYGIKLEVREDKASGRPWVMPV
jgi:iron complex transport system ATP-binding protein